LLTSACYVNVKVVVEPVRGWICAIGKRTTASSDRLET
jgi:hypothetical protein